MRSFIKSSTFSIINSIVQLIISLISGILIARVLGPDGKGQVYLASQIASICSMLFSFGLGPAYLYYIQKKTINQSTAITHAFVVIGLFVITFVLDFTTGFTLLNRLTSGKFSIMMLIMTIWLSVLTLATFFFGYILSSKEDGIERNSVYSIIGSIFYLVVLFFLLIGYKQIPIIVVFAASIPLFTRLILIFHRLKIFAYEFVFAQAFKDTKLLIKYGTYTFLANLMMASLFRVDTFIINAYCDHGDLGLYSVAVNLSEFILLVPAALGLAVFPYLTEQLDESRLSKAATIARLSFLFACACAFMMALFGYPIIYVMFGSKFLSSFFPLLILLPGIIALTTIYGYANYYSSSGRPYVNALVFLIVVFLNLGLNLLLVPKYGINAAAFVSSLTYSMTALAFIVIIHVNEGFYWKYLIIPRKSDFELMFSYVKKLPLFRKAA